MASNTASLVRSNGATSPVQIRVNLVFSGEVDNVNKRSKFNWSAECINTSGSVYGDGNNWSTSRGGGSGFYINPGSTIYLGDGSFWVQHDGNGYAPSQSITLSVSSDNFYVGSGSVTVWEAAPSLATVPATPTTPTVSEVTATSMKLSWSLPSNGGAGLDQMLLRRFTTPDGSGAYVDYPNSGSATERTVNDLTPGTDYYWAVYAHNAVGYSVRSGIRPSRTRAAIRRGKGGSMQLAELRRGKGGVFVDAEVYIGRGGVFVPAR